MIGFVVSTNTFAENNVPSVQTTKDGNEEDAGNRQGFSLNKT